VVLFRNCEVMKTGCPDCSEDRHNPFCFQNAEYQDMSDNNLFVRFGGVKLGLLFRHKNVNFRGVGAKDTRRNLPVRM
jgi:hypothetical protein